MTKPDANTMNSTKLEFPEQEWPLSRVCVFRKPADAFGGFSNMSKSYPLQVFGLRIRSSEHLYQMMRFTGEPEIQELVRQARTPMQSKRVSREWTEFTRPDWDDIRIDVMRWVLRVKPAQHAQRFGDLLRSTGNRDIVEWSKHDSFWGAGPVADDTVRGQNVLGRLLMELREELSEDQADRKGVAAPNFPDARLNGVEIGRLIDSPELPLLTVNDLQKRGLPTGPLLGFVVRVCHQRQLNGEFSTRDEGLPIAERVYRQLSTGRNSTVPSVAGSA